MSASFQHLTADFVQKKKAAPKAKKVIALAGLDGTRIPANIDTLLCEICAAGHCEDKIILCDRCDKGFHLFCLSPPLDDVPDGEWICPHCISRDNDNLFFKTGSQMNFREMREHNATFSKQWFGDRIGQVRRLQFFVLSFKVLLSLARRTEFGATHWDSSPPSTSSFNAFWIVSRNSSSTVFALCNG
jgi:hypothetical protein